MAMPLALLLVLVGGFIFPWWWPGLAGCIAGFWLGRGGLASFLAGFAGAGGAWLSLAAFMDWRNGQILSRRMADLMGLPSPLLLLLLTALVGGLLGGFGAWTGQSLRAYWKARQDRIDAFRG